MADINCAPVLLTVFNRPNETKQVLKRLKQVRPERIFIAADGPRNNRQEDQELCDEVRALVIEAIDWPAQVQKDFAERNLGLRLRMSSAITWALGSTDRLIILEDDCVPDLSFFRFCTELLAVYAEDTRIGAITGNNFQQCGFDCGASYYYSRYPHCWGWATWKRAWRFFDDKMVQWPELNHNRWLETVFQDKLEVKYWEKLFEDTYNNKINTWDYQWTMCLWVKEMLTVTPTVNLVTNVGTGPQATNTKDKDALKHHLEAREMRFPLVAPKEVIRLSCADAYVQATHYGRAKDKTVKGRIKRLIQKLTRYVNKTAGRTLK